MSSFHSRFHKGRFTFLDVKSWGLLLPRAAAAGFATLFLGLALSTGIELARDFRQQSELRQNANQRRLLALVAEVELGNAVQDFKDCLLRTDSSYCDDFNRHIQVLSRTVSLYEAQGTPQPDERRALATLRQALSDYESAITVVRDMQSRHAIIREIDAAVKGADRPIAAGLRKLAALADRRAEWHVPLAQSLLLTVGMILAALFVYLSLPRSTRAGSARSHGAASLLPQLSSQLFEWDEERKAHAFSRLHDGVCQSLSGIMYFLKSAEFAAAANVPESVIPSLQAVIQDTRAVALQLRPPRMEQAGLLATLRSLWVDARSCNGALVIRPRMPLVEFDIPEALKPVILRIARMMVEVAGHSACGSCLTWELERIDQVLRLSVEATTERDPRPVESDRPSDPSMATRSAFDAVQALIMLSGGSLDRVGSDDTNKTLVCSWLVFDGRPKPVG